MKRMNGWVSPVLLRKQATTLHCTCWCCGLSKHSNYPPHSSTPVPPLIPNRLTLLTAPAQNSQRQNTHTWVIHVLILNAETHIQGIVKDHVTHDGRKNSTILLVFIVASLSHMVQSMKPCVNTGVGCHRLICTLCPSSLWKSGCSCHEPLLT